MHKITDQYLEENNMVVDIIQKEAFTIEIQYKDGDGNYLDMSSATVTARARADLKFKETSGDLFTVADGSIDKSKAGISGKNGSILGVPVTTGNLDQASDFYMELKVQLGDQVDKYIWKMNNQAGSSS